MRFTIDADCKRGLRVIEEIPDFEVGSIEGYNGIGKSTALRLLELCTGLQPYKDKEQLWRSLRDQLAHATVRVTGLQDGAREITWDLDPSAWPHEPEPLGDPHGSIRIDDTPASFTDVASLLRVHTIVGNETFPAALAGRLETAARRIGAWAGYGSAIARRREALEDLLKESLTAIQAPSAGHLKELQLKLANAEAHRREAALALQRTQARVAQLSEAEELAEQLDDIRGRGPGLSEQLADIERQQEALGRERSALDAQITETGRREHQEEAARQEFTRARKFLDRCESELREARGRLNAAAAEAGVGPAPGPIAAAQEELSAILDELTEKLPKISASPFIARLLGDIADRLRQAEASGLGEEVLMSAGPASPGWTVRVWREACEREATSRAAQSAPETARQIEDEITRVRRRLQLLAQASDRLAEVDQTAERKERGARRLADAIENLPPGEAVTIDQLVSRREQAEAQLTELAERRAAVAHALSLVGGGIDEDTLRQRLTRICEEAGVPESRVRGQLESERRLLAEAQGASEASRRDEGTAREKLQASAGAVHSALSALRQRPDLSFARNATGNLILGEGAGEVSQAEALGALREAIERARRRVQGTGEQIQVINAALDVLARQYRGTGALDRGADWARPVQEWLAGQVSTWFSHDDVREALFPEGHDISVDVAGMAVEWTAEGERRTRPMAAFSSGQEALAYTRARMASLDSGMTEAANRLIALDEFGAFIAADGMRRLSGYLLDRYQEFPRDQVVVVRALRREIQDAPDPADLVTADQLRQLQQRGYLTERITR